MTRPKQSNCRQSRPKNTKTGTASTITALTATKIHKHSTSKTFAACRPAAKTSRPHALLLQAPELSHTSEHACTTRPLRCRVHKMGPVRACVPTAHRTVQFAYAFSGTPEPEAPLVEKPVEWQSTACIPNRTQLPAT